MNEELIEERKDEEIMMMQHVCSAALASILEV